MEFYKPSEVDFSNLAFSKKKPFNRNKFEMVKVFYNKKYLGLKLPCLKIPFNTNITKFNQLEINLSLGQNQELIDQLKNLDQQIQEHAVKQNWFGNEPNIKYIPTLKQSENSDFPPLVKIKVYSKEDEVSGSFYDENKKQLPVKNRQDVLDITTKNTWIQTAIECSGVWFMSGNYGLAWKAEQIRVKTRPKQEDNDGYAFWSDDSSVGSNTNVELLIDEDE